MITPPADLIQRTHVRKQAFVNDLRTLVEFETPSLALNHLSACFDWLHDRLRVDGWSLKHELTNTVGHALLGTLEGSSTGPSTLLLAHIDTVWPIGTLRTLPFRDESPLIHGPGVYDMKAGLVLGLHAVALARVAGGLAGAVSLLINSDEEIGSIHSRALIEREALRHDRVFVLEPATRERAMVITRKGAGDFHVHLRGRSAHSGEAFQEGINAIHELAYLIRYVEGLSDFNQGTTAAVTVVAGGTVSNVIPSDAKASIDLRVEQPAEAERVERAIRAYRAHDPRVLVSVEGAIKRPPMPTSQASAVLVGQIMARAAALDIDLPVGGSGGGSDANFCAALGVPTVDGLGAVGAGAHAITEHIELPATLERLALLADLLRTR